MNIKIEVIPHDQQRYPTVGDWFFEPNGDLTIKVSKMSDARFEALVAVHELVEVLICQHDGVTQEQVDAFDMEYERTRPEGDDSEPGDSVYAPYGKQHCIATAVERLLAAELGVSWKVYDDEVMSL